MAAQKAYDWFSRNGYRVAFNWETFKGGQWFDKIKKQLESSRDVIVVVSDSTLKVNNNEHKIDYQHFEIRQSLELNKNIIPLYMHNLPSNWRKNSHMRHLDGDVATLLKDVNAYNGVDYYPLYADACMKLIQKKRLSCKPIVKMNRIAIGCMVLLAFLLGHSLYKSLEDKSLFPNWQSGKSYYEIMRSHGIETKVPGAQHIIALERPGCFKPALGWQWINPSTSTQLLGLYVSIEKKVDICDLNDGFANHDMLCAGVAWSSDIHLNERERTSEREGWIKVKVCSRCGFEEERFLEVEHLINPKNNVDDLEMVDGCSQCITPPKYA